MHAIYSSLLNLDLSPPDSEGLTADELAEEATGAAESAFEYRLSERLDDNNWYTHCVLLLDDGRIFQLAEDGDYRGRDSVFREIEEMPVGDRWQWARDFTARSIAADMELFGSCSFFLSAETDGDRKLATMNADQVVAAIRTEAPKMLAAAYADIERPPPDGEPAFLAGYRRKKLAIAFEAIIDAENAPFVSDGLTPYDIRAFDLTGGEPGNAILLTDIHT